MIRLAYRFTTALLIVFIAFVASANAVVDTFTVKDTCRYKDHEVRKTIHHEFPLHDNSTVKLFNKYGALNIHAWDKNEIHIDVEIIVNSCSKSIAEL